MTVSPNRVGKKISLGPPRTVLTITKVLLLLSPLHCHSSSSISSFTKGSHTIRETVKEEESTVCVVERIEEVLGV